MKGDLTIILPITEYTAMDRKVIIADVLVSHLKETEFIDSTTRTLITAYSKGGRMYEKNAE